MSPEEYRERLLALERAWQIELRETIARVEKALAPMPVSEGWVNSLVLPTHPVTQRHLARVHKLEAEFYGVEETECES